MFTKCLPTGDRLGRARTESLPCNSDASEGVPGAPWDKFPLSVDRGVRPRAAMSRMTSRSEKPPPAFRSVRVRRRRGWVESGPENANTGSLERTTNGDAKLMLDWARTEARIAAIKNERPNEYDEATLQNLTELLELLRATHRPLPAIAPGYWPTFLLTWETERAFNLEIEVFGDRYEIYRFFDGATQIWDELHIAGEFLSSEFLAELPDPI